jgi:hypothetical protein
MKLVTRLRSRAERRDRPIGIPREARERRVLAREDLEDVVDLAKRRVGAADHLAQVLPAPAEPVPSSLRMIEKRCR